jgi:hypothetical protein
MVGMGQQREVTNEGIERPYPDGMFRKGQA